MRSRVRETGEDWTMVAEHGWMFLRIYKYRSLDVRRQVRTSGVSEGV